jgi:hypothetical protein
MMRLLAFVAAIALILLVARRRPAEPEAMEAYRPLDANWPNDALLPVDARLLDYMAQMQAAHDRAARHEWPRN